MNANLDQIILNRLTDLIDSGHRILDHKVASRYGDEPHIEYAVLDGWNTRCQVFLNDALGEEHTYSKRFAYFVAQNISYPDLGLQSNLAVLVALKDDMVAGYLSTYRELIHAALFSDFLEMAEYLLSDGYKDPAAMLGGGVLEEHLRQLCTKHHIPTEMNTSKGPQPKKADQMNSDLAKQNVYSLLNQKQITAWLDLRNKAAHGRFSEYTADQVSLMLVGVRGFLANHPA